VVQRTGAGHFDPAVYDLALRASASEVLTTEVNVEEIFQVIRRMAED